MSEFVERLDGLLVENNLNKKSFSIKIHINAASITHYLQGKRLPTVENLIKIADFFNVSTDFLLGREEESSSLRFKSVPAFSDRIEFLKGYFGRSAYSIYNNTGISKSSYYDWKKGKRQPTVENVIRLADLFDCTVDFVLGREI